MQLHKQPGARWETGFIVPVELSAALAGEGNAATAAPAEPRKHHPYLFNVYQLGLVDLGDGDVVLGSDGESPLEKAEGCA